MALQGIKWFCLNYILDNSRITFPPVVVERSEINLSHLDAASSFGLVSMNLFEIKGESTAVVTAPGLISGNSEDTRTK